MLVDKYLGVFFLFFQCNSYQSKNMSNMSNYPSIGQSRINHSIYQLDIEDTEADETWDFTRQKLVLVAKSIGNSVPRLIKWLTELLSYSPTWNMRGCLEYLGIPWNITRCSHKLATTWLWECCHMTRKFPSYLDKMVWYPQMLHPYGSMATVWEGTANPPNYSKLYPSPNS